MCRRAVGRRSPRHNIDESPPQRRHIQGIAKAPPPVVALIAALAALHPSHAGKRTIDEPTSNATRKGLRKHLLELQKAWFNPEVGSSQSSVTTTAAARALSSQSER